MKTAFTSHEIAHVWANQSAPHGKSPGAMSFNGPVIYSYQTAMARHIEHKGKRAIILNTTSYSATTSSKHAPRIRSAVYGHDVPVFRVNDNRRGTDLRFTGQELFTHYIEQAAKAEASALLPRIRQTTRDSHKAKAAHYLEQAQAVATFYGLRKKVDSKAVARLAASKAKAEKRAAIEQEKRELLEKAQQIRAYHAWYENTPLLEGESRYFNARLFPVAFRVEGEELVSTLGARVPLQAARVAYRFATSKRAQGWHRNGETHTVGMYHLDAINAQGIVAGCHRIAWSEIERLAPVLA